MPELPEVEAARKLLELHCVGKKITFVNAVDDEKVFEGVSPTAISAALLHKTPLSAQRVGKHCYLDFGPNDPALLLHLGMTGGTIIRGKGGAHYQRYSILDDTWPPKFLRLELHFEDGTQWAFCDSRRFARIRLVKDPLQSPPLKDLGWDPLLSWPTLEVFSAALSQQRRAIKALLLDQSFSAGVGNWVADEVLYQSRIHPEQPANSLAQEQAQEVHKQVHDVCRLACEVDADSTKLPETWLFHHRWGKGAATKAKIGGHTIDHITVGGRTSAYVPTLQKLVKTKDGGGGKVAVKKTTTTTKVAATKPKSGKAATKEGKRVSVEVEEVQVQEGAAGADVEKNKKVRRAAGAASGAMVAVAAAAPSSMKPTAAQPRKKAAPTKTKTVLKTRTRQPASASTASRKAGGTLRKI